MKFAGNDQPLTRPGLDKALALLDLGPAGQEFDGPTYQLLCKKAGIRS